MKEYLEIIVQGFTSKIYMEFSDKEMKLWLSGQYSEKTVRNITKKLLDDEIIELSKIGNKGEKFYKIIDERKANLLYNQSISTYVSNRKHKPKIRFTPTKIDENPSSNLNNSFFLKLQIDGKTEKKWYYPKINYQNKICPICNGKLIGFKHDGSITKNKLTHDLDKKCNKCKSKFYYNPPSTKYSKDDSITIDASASVRQYLLGDLVEKSKMDSLTKETKKILEKANPKWKDYFE